MERKPLEDSPLLEASLEAPGSSKKTRSSATSVFITDDDDDKYRQCRYWRQSLGWPLLVVMIIIMSTMVLVSKNVPAKKNLVHGNNNNNKDNGDDTHEVRVRGGGGGVNVAFVGNSMFYFNDFPRFFQALAGDELVRHQDSCLHGGGSIPSLLMEGNGMYPQFGTPSAILEGPTDEMHHPIYDYGACTPEQLVTGRDIRLVDPGYAQPQDKTEGNLNPCREDATYLEWATQYYNATRTQWHYVMINDNTRNPARASTRARSKEFLEQFWAPLLRESGATPVFLWTHAYQALDTIEADHNMTGLEDVANFTSLTYVGLQAYVRLLSPLLPVHQQPRIAPSGLAFLAVYQDNRTVWKTLFHNADHLHASPSGTFLQGLCVYHTLFGRLPAKSDVVRKDMQDFWKSARMMQHAWEPENPIPTQEEASYLYDVAQRVLEQGHIPSTFINYTNGEAAYEQD